MNDVKKYILQGIVVATFGAMSWWVGTIWKTTNVNKEYSIKHHNRIEVLENKVTTIEYEIGKINTNFVTRRELDIRLQNLENKITNIDKTLEKLDAKLDKVIDKI